MTCTWLVHDSDEQERREMSDAQSNVSPTGPYPVGGCCSRHGQFSGSSCAYCNYEQPATTWVNPYEATLQRIATAVERIARALEPDLLIRELAVSEPEASNPEESV